MRKTIEKQEEVKKEFNLKEAFVLWRNKAQSGNYYLSGFASEECGSQKLVGYFVSNKKNPKEPDVRVYTLDAEGNQDKEVASIWENISKNDVRYLTGVTDDKEKLVCFYGKENEEKRPYIRAYFRED